MRYNLLLEQQSDFQVKMKTPSRNKSSMIHMLIILPLTLLTHDKKSVTVAYHF